MKKLLLAGVLAATTTFGVNASVLTFNGSLFGDADVTFDNIDFDDDFATVTQTDDGDGAITGNDAFTEFGLTSLISFGTGGANYTPSAYEFWLDYSFSGEASTDPGFLQVLFAGGSADLVIDTDLTLDGQGAQVFNGGTTIGSMTMNGGSCNIFGTVGVCNLFLDFVPVDTYFSYNGEELNNHLNNGAVATANLIVTVQNIIGLFPTYAEQEAFLAANNLPSDGDDVQVFQIKHDGNMSIEVPEPTSIAILGLGLLGLAGLRRRA
ncbi:flocculation-associated PEP-CTERM protein PepA [Thalassotalea ganghwensis]